MMIGYGAAPHARLRLAADWLAAGVLAALPWSTSLTAVLVVLLIMAVVPTIALDEARDALTSPAMFLPVLLWAFACIGMVWADVAWAERLQGLRPFHKLLVVPLLLLHFRRSPNGARVAAAFLVSAVLLLIVSWMSLRWPQLTIGDRAPGVPVKDYIYQGITFVLAVCAFLYLSFLSVRQRRYGWAGLCIALAAAFLANMAYVAASRTAIVILPVLLALVGYTLIGSRGAAFLAAAAIAALSLAWATSPYFHARINATIERIARYDPRVETSESLRLEFWRKSLTIISEAPLIGHGVGSIAAQFAAKTPAGEQGAVGRGSSNPHNQTFFTGVQLGLAGVALMYLMWLSHLLLFRGCGWPAIIGLVVVTQNVLAGLFNSHLADFTAGWLYVFGVGVVGGTMLGQRARDAARAGAVLQPAARAGGC